MGALIDKIAASGNFSSYARPAQGDGPTTALRAANALALDLTEDLRDLGLDIFVLWEGDWVRLNCPSGSHFSFAAVNSDVFRLDHNRERPVSCDELIYEIVKWVATVQRELYSRRGQQKGHRI
jgi:hypothetical protein